MPRRQRQNPDRSPGQTPRRVRAHQCLQGLAPSATDFILEAGKRDAQVTGPLRISAANPLRKLLAHSDRRVHV